MPGLETVHIVSLSSLCNKCILRSVRLGSFPHATCMSNKPICNMLSYITDLVHTIALTDWTPLCPLTTFEPVSQNSSNFYRQRKSSCDYVFLYLFSHNLHLNCNIVMAGKLIREGNKEVAGLVTSTRKHIHPEKTATVTVRPHGLSDTEG
jgi:hypothetical protein